MRIVEFARERIVADFGLKSALEKAFEQNVGAFQRTLGLDDRAMRESLAGDAGFRRNLAATLCIGESFFMRGAEQYDVVAEHVFKLLQQMRAPVIWSAGCARGEEPYSIAIALTERWGSSLRGNVTILGTDLDGKSVQIARAGLYGSWSFRGVPLELLGKYFVRTEQGHRVADSLLGWPRFHHMSIQEQLAMLAPGTVDLILFRNVGIYLTDAALKEIHAGFARALAADGLLVQAVTDPSPASIHSTPKGLLRKPLTWIFMCGRWVSPGWGVFVGMPRWW